MTTVAQQLDKYENRPAWVRRVEKASTWPSGRSYSGSIRYQSPQDRLLNIASAATIISACVAFIVAIVATDSDGAFPTGAFFSAFGIIFTAIAGLGSLFYVLLPIVNNYRFRIPTSSATKRTALEKYSALSEANQELARASFIDVLEADDNNDDRVWHLQDIFNQTLSALKEQDRLIFEIERLQPRESQHVLTSINEVNENLSKQVTEYKELSR